MPFPARWACALGLLLLASTVAVAEDGAPGYRLERPTDATAEDIEAARGFFASGEAAASGGRWSDALGHFEEAYRRSGVAAALFNVASTLRSLGRHRDARDAYAQLLSEHPDLDPETRAQALAGKEEQSARVAELTLAGLATVSADAELRLDGEPVPHGRSDPFVLEVDPGKHTIQVIATGREPFSASVALGDGERRLVRVELTPSAKRVEPVPTGRGAATVAPTPARDRRGVSPVLWVVLSVVAVGAAATATGIALDRRADLSPQSDVVLRP